jgi:hypothetical protein
VKVFREKVIKRILLVILIGKQLLKTMKNYLQYQKDIKQNQTVKEVLI